MKRDELWTAYITRNPQFAGEEPVTMSAAGLKKLFEQTWVKAHEAGVANGLAQAKLRQQIDRTMSGAPSPDIFDTFFGGKP